MLFRILGPVEVWDAGRRVPVGGPQQVGLLAVLLLGANRVISADRLVDELWAGQPPAAGRRLVQGCVLRLRRVLPPLAGRQRLATAGRGYLIEVGPGELDLDVFEELAAAAEVRIGTGKPAGLMEAAGLLREALALWRGPALDGVAAEACAIEARRLAERRREVVERRIDVELASGRHPHLIGELSELVDEDPLRERLWAQLMVALAGAGRHVDALAAYRRLRNTLVEQLGVEPSTTLAELERAVLSSGDAWATYRNGYSVPVGDRGSAPADAGGPLHPARVAPAQLPAAVAAFTGRDGELGRLDWCLADPVAGAATAVVITAIAGTAGVGKTALAVHWAHRVRDRFPDGQLYVNLRGFASAAPVRPIDALGGFLRTLGIPTEQVPGQVEQAAALYRSMVADRRMLVLLDNAAGSEQVRPLLPGGPGCLVVVTSRDRLGGLVALDGAQRVTLDVLTPDEAQALLARVLGPDRVAAEPEAARDLARACAWLPLALRIAAANLTAQPARDIAGFVTELTADDRLARLEVDGDEHGAVRAAFDQSYASLSEDGRRLFGRLGLVPGADFTAAAAAALVDTGPRNAGRLLERLAAAHLLTEHRPGRYTFHDLLRAYARDRVDADEPVPARDAAARRLFDWYLYTTDAAARLLYPEKLRLPLTPPAGGTAAGAGPAAAAAAPAAAVGAPAAGGGIDDHTQALAWLDAERANLAAAVHHAAEHGPQPVAWLLADALRGYLLLRMHLVDLLTVAGAALAAAEVHRDLCGQAAAHLSLANARMIMGEMPQAIEHYEHALALAGQTGWLDCQSAALGSLGGVYWQLGRLREAADHHTRALALNRQTGRRAGQAINLGNLGLLYQDLGQLERAVDYYTQALALDRELGSAGGAALTLASLGETRHALGQLDAALDHLDQALALHRETGNLGGETEAHRAIAEVHRDAGRPADALDAARTAHDLARETGERRHEAFALNAMASIDLRLGRHVLAIEHFQRALELARRDDNRYAAVVALVGLATARVHAGEPDAAGVHANEAVDLADQAGYRMLEGQARTARAAVDLALDEPERAARHAREALAIQRETGHRLGAAKALLVLGDALHRSVGRPAAGPQWELALALFTDIGTPEADRVRALLQHP